MATYLVKIPIAGHAYVEVEADNEDAAKSVALDTVDTIHIESWKPLRKVNTGNVCHFPTPWEIEVEEA